MSPTDAFFATFCTDAFCVAAFFAAFAAFAAALCAACFCCFIALIIVFKLLLFPIGAELLPLAIEVETSVGPLSGGGLNLIGV